MRHLFLIALACLLAAGVLAQEDESTGLIDAWHLSTSGTMDPRGASFWVSFSQDPSGATIVAETGQVLVKHGSPSRVSDGTWPAGLSGAQGFAETFDGASDYWTSTIAPPAGSFSVACVVTPSSVAAADHMLIGNFNPTGDLRGWRLYLNAATANFDISDDGTAGAGHLTTVTKAASIAVGRRSFISVTVNTAGGDGSVAVSLVVDGLAAATSATADGPVFATAANLSLFGAADASSLFGGTGHDCRTFPVVLTATDLAQLRAQWLGTGDAGSSPGNNVAVTSAAPSTVLVAAAASGTEPFLVDQPVNSSMVGAYGLYGAAAQTNLSQRGSFETWAAGAATGWTETPTSTGDCVQTVASKAHGLSSARCTNADADDAITEKGACLTVTEATAYYLSVYAKKVSGTPVMTVSLAEDDSADCGSPTATTVIVNAANPTTSWVKYGGTRTTGAGVIRAQIIITLPAAAAQSVDIDAASLFAGAVAVDQGCFTDADASAVCNASIEAVPTKITAGSWTIQGTWQSPIDGAEANAKFLYRVGIGAANSVSVFHASDEVNCGVYDSAGAAHWSAVAAASNANEAWDFKCQHADAGGASGWTVTACAKLHTDAAWTCDATPATGATMDGVDATSYLANTSAAGNNMWVRDVQIFRRVR